MLAKAFWFDVTVGVKESNGGVRVKGSAHQSLTEDLIRSVATLIEDVAKPAMDALNLKEPALTNYKIVVAVEIAEALSRMSNKKPK